MSSSLDRDLGRALFGYLRFVTCEKRTVEHKQLPGENAFRPQSDLAIAQRFSKRKYLKSAQT